MILIPTLHAQSWEYTHNKHRYTKAPWLPMLYNPLPPSEGWQPIPIWKMRPSLKYFQGCHWRESSLLRSALRENRITHRWFFSTPPQGSMLPLEHGPQCSSSPSPNSSGSWGRSAGSPSISCQCWKCFLPGRETETRKEVPGKEEWADTWQPQRGTTICCGGVHFQIPLFHPPHSYPLPMLNTHTYTPTVSLSSSLKHWVTATSRKLLSQVNQGFLHYFISMHDHGGLHAKIQSEHRAVDFWELRTEMHVIVKEVNIL